MARDTIASMRADVERMKERLATAKARDYSTCSIRDLSSALLDRLDTLRNEQRDSIDEAEVEFDKIESAYGEADGADDRVRELDL